MLIAWRYHIEGDSEIIGLHFLALNAGYLIAVVFAERLTRRVAIRTLALVASALGFGALVALSFLGPPVAPIWRMLGVALVGSAGGTLVTALLHASKPYFSAEPANAANMSGLFFGCGCLISTLVVGVTYYAGSTQIETLVLAAVPVVFFVMYAGNKLPSARAPIKVGPEETLQRDNMQHVRKVAAFLFALLLFFQFGNEWAIAGWLPLFLIHRLGCNPDWAIFALALYFLTLMLGRLLARGVLTKVSHKRLLVGSIVVAMSGYMLLSLTSSMTIAWVAIIVIGIGFAPIYPLVAENLDERFSFHPGFYNGILSIGITGGMCMPWLLGYIESYWGMRYVMLIPTLGSVAVLLLVLLLMFESHLMGTKNGAALETGIPAGTGKV